MATKRPLRPAPGTAIVETLEKQDDLGLEETGADIGPDDVIDSRGHELGHRRLSLGIEADGDEPVRHALSQS